MKPVYLIVTSHGAWGRQYLGYPEDSRADIVRQVAEGQHDGIIRVVELVEADGKSRDITREIQFEAEALRFREAS